MNTIYRVIWNHTLGVYQVCSELTKRMTQSFALTLSGRSELNKKHNRYPQLQQITLIITLGLSSSTLAATTFNGEYTFDENKSYAGYIVGANASGTLNIGTNIVASVSDASSSVIGQGTNGRGTVNVYDGGFWDLVDHRYGADSPLSLNIGQEGNGVLNIESGGLVTVGQVILGKLVSGSGEVNVSGNGSILNTRDMLVGQSGTGELLISDYGLVNSSFSSSIGQSRGSSGVVHIENNGQWIIRGTDGQYLDLVVGDSGEGEFYLSTGGKASVGQIQIGKNNTGNGVINVSGVGTELNTYAIQTGLNGVGTLNISNYGVVNSTKSGAVAFAGNSVGIVNVSNHGHWIIKAENGAYQVLNVGVQGYGTVNIESGGVIDADIVTAGFENTGGGLINTANAGSELNIRGLRVGFGSDAILNISDSAVVNNTGQNTFGNNEYVRGTVNITDNGHLNSTGTGSNVGMFGAGDIYISSGGKMTDTGTTVLGFYPSGRGIVDIKNASSSMVLQALVLGYQGNGRLDISDTAKVSNGGYVVLGQSNGSIGIANVSDSGRWEAGAQEFYVGYDGNGTLNINSAGQVIVGNAYAGVSGTGVGIVNIDGNGTKFQSAVLTVGHSGAGTLNLVNQGELELTGQSMTIAANSGSTGTVNIGAPAGMNAVAPGTIHNLGVINFGNGNGNLVFNHTNNTSAGYNVDSVILGGYADTAIIHDAGHTIFTGNNIYDGYTNINGGILTIASHSENGDDGLGISKVIISQNGTLQIEAANSENDSFRFKNMLSGSGILNVNLSSTNKIYTFMDSTGNAFTGITEMDRSTFILEKANTVTLTHAMLQSNAGNIIHVGAGEKNIGGLAFNGGTLIFDTPVPAYLNANGRIIAETLVAGSGNYSWSGHDQNVSGNGVVKIAMQDPWHDPMAASPNNTLNLLEQDDTHPMLQLIKADNVMGSGGSLQLQAMNEEPIPEDKRLKIAQHGVEVATGHYGFRLTTAPGDGLYVNYGLNKLDIHANKELVLAEREGDRQSAADMSAQIIGEGHLVIDTAGQVSLSNGNNNYSGDTRINKGVLRTDANDALGKTANLSISNLAQLNLNATAQTVRTFSGQSGSLLDFNGGYLTLSEGGISNGMLTGEGNFHVTGNILDIIGANGNLSVTHIIDSGAEISLNNGAGAGRGNIVNEGILRLKGVKNTLSNSLRGRGEVYATAGTDVHLRGDNSNFSGLFNIEDGSAITISEQKQLGTAGVIDHGMLIVMTGQNWQLKNEIIGNGDLEKTGDATLTLTNASAGYSGTTQITAGELTLGATLDSIVKMTSTQINIHNGAVMSGFVATAKNVDVMQGGELHVSRTTIGGDLVNSGTVRMNRSGASPGNQLIVNGNYTGNNNGLIAFNTTLNGDESPTDKVIVTGDTRGSTRVVVNNIDGQGAQTDKGIELIEVNGDSAGSFALTHGTVEAGAYVYSLAKGTGEGKKNWYLTSQWHEQTSPGTDVSKPPTVDPQRPAMLRPEAGSYISNLAAANTLFNHRLHDRLGEPQYTDVFRNEGDFASSLWLRQVGGHERSTSGYDQLKTQSNRYVVQLGGDLAQWNGNSQDRWHLGIMGGYANEHSNTRNERVGYHSDGRIDGYSVGMYGTWYQNDADKVGAYVDSWVLYNWFNNTVESDHRQGDSYRSRGFTASVEAGYTFLIGEFTGSEGTLNSGYVQPQVQVTWMGVKEGNHTRSDGTYIETEGDGNVQTRLGVRTYLNSYHRRDAGKQREFQPYIEANYLYNSEVYAVKMNGTKISREGSRHLAELRTGVEAKLNNNLAMWGNVGVQIGDKGYSDTQGMLGVKYSW